MRIDRIRKRKFFDINLCKKIIKFQESIDKYKKKSDFIIENNQTIEKLKLQIEKNNKNNMNNFVVYEQPVAENIRSFLKCEYLHEKINSSLSLESIWSIKSSISALLEMSDFSQRINLKVELLKELEKIGFTLQKLNEDNEIELSKFDAYKTEVDRCLANLNDINDNPSKTILDNDFLMLVKSKLHIPAGDNFFDMPSYLNFLTSKKII